MKFLHRRQKLCDILQHLKNSVEFKQLSNKTRMIMAMMMHPFISVLVKMSHSTTWRELILFNFRLNVDYVTRKKVYFSLANQLGNVFLLFSVLMFVSNYRSALYSLSSSVRYDLSLLSAKKAKDFFVTTFNVNLLLINRIFC